MLANINPLKHQGHGDNRGFTLVELNISMTVMGILAVGFMAIFTTFVTVTNRTNYTIEMTNDSQNLLRTMVEELRNGAGVRQTNSAVTNPDPNSPAGGWNTGNTNFVIITAVPAQDSSNEYILDPATGRPYLNEFVYYKQASVLYKRTLAHKDAVGNKIKTSCPAALASATCPADKKLVETIKTMAFVLYDQDNALTTDPLLARSIKIDLTLEKKTFGAPLTFDNSIRTTLRNTF